ncbi:outer membrane protein assembly factor BamE [Aquicoccus sp. SCR17]|nr:outer membrane protein assembly factor BamE [Carideicomes alvinocaridis]
MQGRPIGATAALLAGALALSACTAQYRNHGFVPSESDLSSIQLGVDTRESIAENVGTPSTTDLIDDSGYYYVRSRFRHFAYREPEVVDRKVVAISFDPTGHVSNVETFGLERGAMVPLTRRVTPVAGGTSNFLRRLLRNLGRFSPADFFN